MSDVSLQEKKSRLLLHLEEEHRYQKYVSDLTLTLMPLLFCTSCHMWASTLLWGGCCWCRDGLMGATANPPPVFRLWSGAHTQLVIT